VPNPAFVEVNSALPNNVTNTVAAAVIGYGGGGAISGWSKPAREPYAALASRLTPVRKQGIFSPADSAKIDSRDVMSDMASLKDPWYVAVRHHFVRTSRLE
jgi:hypothetical protein